MECIKIVFTNDKFSKMPPEQNIIALSRVSKGVLTVCLKNFCPNVFIDHVKHLLGE